MVENLDKFIVDLQKSILEEARVQYTTTVIEHWMYPRNFDGLSTPDGYAEYTGPCGDTMQIFLKIKNNKISEAGFQTNGCGATIACGSMITSLVEGKNIPDARNISPDTILQALGGLPEENQHCSLLAATTLQKAINNYEQPKKEPWNSS